MRRLLTKCFGVFLMGKKSHKHKNDSFLSRMLKEDTNVSAMNFFLLATLAVGVILLFIPAVGMVVDIIHNRTMTINLSDMATYILAVAGIFTAGGLSSAWTEFAYSKFNVKPITEDETVRSRLEAHRIYEDSIEGEIP